MKRAWAMAALGAAVVAGTIAGGAGAPKTGAGVKAGTPLVNGITSFATNHPEWAALRLNVKDSARLRLNHAVHMKADDPAMRARIEAMLKAGGPAAQRLAVGEGGFALTCVSCHENDEAGRYMLPVRFDAHCAHCHTEDLGTVNVAPGVVQPGSAPHGDVSLLGTLVEKKLLEWAALERAKPAAPAGEEAGAAPAAPTAPAAAPAPPTSNRPGARKPGSASAAKKPGVPAFASPEEASRWLTEQRTEALSGFKNNCVKCHEVEESSSADAPAPFGVLATEVPDRWLGRSVFSHVAHGMLSCTACHTKAAESVATEDVLIAGIESCRACHAPAPAKSVVARAVSFAGLSKSRGEATAPGTCVTCHVYHERIGAQGSGTLSVPEFLGAPASGTR